MTNIETIAAASTIDDVIKGIVGGGHPKAKRLAEDYDQGREQLLSENPQMTIADATIETLASLLEQAYGIHYTYSLADRLDALGETVSGDDAAVILATADDIRVGKIAVEPEAGFA